MLYMLLLHSNALYHKNIVYILVNLQILFLKSVLQKMQKSSFTSAVSAYESELPVRIDLKTDIFKYVVKA